MSVKLSGRLVGTLDDLDIRPMLSGQNNSYSVTLGGPACWVSIYRSLIVDDETGRVL